MDMKYTALYWALQYVEDDLDIYVKKYNGYPITIKCRITNGRLWKRYSAKK